MEGDVLLTEAMAREEAAAALAAGSAGAFMFWKPEGTRKIRYQLAHFHLSSTG